MGTGKIHYASALIPLKKFACRVDENCTVPLAGFIFIPAPLGLGQLLANFFCGVLYHKKQTFLATVTHSVHRIANFELLRFYL